MSQDLRYRVRLTAAASDGDGGTVETERIDYYDSGIWVTVGGGRDFYPYERIAVIEERPAAAFESVDEAAADGEAGGDEPDPEGEAEEETAAEDEAVDREAGDEEPVTDDDAA